MSEHKPRDRGFLRRQDRSGPDDSWSKFHNMSASGVVVGAIAIFLGQPICQFLGLPSWASTIFQVVCRLLVIHFVVVCHLLGIQLVVFNGSNLLG